jgi:hypothetical protein
MFLKQIGEKMLRKICLAGILLLFSVTAVEAQSPQGKSFGFGIMLGDPTGGTAKYWMNRENALAFSAGASFFGSPRIGIDYLWHINAFDSDIANIYAGPGGIIGFGRGSGLWSNSSLRRSGGEAGIAGRGVFGINVIPRDTPLEVFAELGVLLGLAPSFGSAVDAALGVRFYP